jgi:putative Ca2+/H+ antiporter (TMEM165/GDT1 family)
MTPFLKTFLVRITYTAIITGLSVFLTYQWATANAEKQQALAVSEALQQQSEEIAEQHKAIDNIVTAYNTEVMANEDRTEKDQRRLRQLRRELAETNNDLAHSRDIIKSAYGLLHNATNDSELPANNHPAGIDNAYETTTELELISYTRKIIAEYEREGLRANKLREVIKDLPCVN